MLSPLEVGGHGLRLQLGQLLRLALHLAAELLDKYGPKKYRSPEWHERALKIMHGVATYMCPSARPPAELRPIAERSVG